MITPKDLQEIEDPLELFQRVTAAIVAQQESIDHLAEIRARAVAALHAQGYSYKDLSKILNLSAPRVGQLVVSNDDASVRVIRAWAMIEQHLAEIAAIGKSGTRWTLRSALMLIENDTRFDRQIVRDIYHIRGMRNDCVHGRSVVPDTVAQEISDRATYIGAVLQILKSELRFEADDPRRPQEGMAVKSNVVRWQELDAGTFEQMVSVLVSRTYPKAIRIDGSGGDEGRDIILEIDGRMEVFQIKSFTGRLTAPRRRQIERSLKEATRHNPSTWYLIVPIDPTPRELDWFKTLAGGMNFPCRWLGRSWLDAQASSYPEVARYYLQGAQDEIVSALIELHKEQAALARGVPDAVERLVSLSTRLNQLDPHYSFGISIKPNGQAEISTWPKFLNAERDHPARLESISFRGDTDEGQQASQDFENAIRYGTPATLPKEAVKELVVDLPGGLARKFTEAAVEIGAAEATMPNDVRVELQVMDKDGTTVAQLPLRLESRVAGSRGSELEFSDSVRILKVLLRHDQQRRQIDMKLTFAPSPQVPVSATAAVVRLLAAMGGGRSVVFLFDGKEASKPLALEGSQFAHMETLLSFLYILEDIQRVTGIYLLTPESFDASDVAAAEKARRLLSGEHVSEKWTRMSIVTTGVGVEAMKAKLDQGHNSITSEAVEVLSLGTQEIPLGRVRRTLASVTVPSWPDVTRDGKTDELLEIVVRPGEDDSVTSVLLEREGANP